MGRSKKSGWEVQTLRLCCFLGRLCFFYCYVVSCCSGLSSLTLSLFLTFAMAVEIGQPETIVFSLVFVSLSCLGSGWVLLSVCLFHQVSCCFFCFVGGLSLVSWLRGLVPVLLLFMCCPWCFGRLTILDGQGNLQVPADCFCCCWFLVVVAGLSFGLSALALSLYFAFAMITSFWMLLSLLDLFDGAVFLLSLGWCCFSPSPFG